MRSIAATAPLVLAALAAAAAAPVLAEEPSSPQPEPPAAAVRDVLKRLRANDGPVRAGMHFRKADGASAGAARFIDDRVLPLRGSWLDPEGRRTGTITWDVDLDTESIVDTIQVVVLTGPIDREAMTKEVVKAAREVGLALEPCRDLSGLLNDGDATGVDLWVAVGDGLVVLESELVEE